jgi:hypothetical protein
MRNPVGRWQECVAQREGDDLLWYRIPAAGAATARQQQQETVTSRGAEDDLVLRTRFPPPPVSCLQDISVTNDCFLHHHYDKYFIFQVFSSE